MNADEKNLAQSIVEALNILPNEEQKFILGYAEGVRSTYAALHSAQPSE